MSEEADIDMDEEVIGFSGIGKTGYRKRMNKLRDMQAGKIERQMGVPAKIFIEDAIHRVNEVYESAIYSSIFEEVYGGDNTIKELTLEDLKNKINAINPFRKYEGNIANIKRKAQAELFRARGSDGKRRSLSDLYKSWVYPMKSANFLNTWGEVDIIRRFAGMMVDYVSNNYDFVLANVGEEGTMKSSFSLGLAVELVRKGMNFDILSNMFFASTPFEYIIHRIENTTNQVFIFDEAQKHFDNRNFNIKEQKDLVQAIVNSRAKGHIIILNTPDIYSIDIRFRDRRVRGIVNLIDGKYGLYIHRHSAGAKKDPFMLKRLERNISKLNYFTGENIVTVARKIKTVYLIFKMTNYPVSKEMFEFYNILKNNMNKVKGSIEKKIGGFNKNLVFDYLYLSLKYQKDSDELFNKLSRHYSGLPVELIKMQIKKIILPYVSKMRRRHKKSKAGKQKMFDEDVYINEADMRGEIDWGEQAE